MAGLSIGKAEMESDVGGDGTGHESDPDRFELLRWQRFRGVAAERPAIESDGEMSGKTCLRAAISVIIGAGAAPGQT